MFRSKKASSDKHLQESLQPIDWKKEFDRMKFVAQRYEESYEKILEHNAELKQELHLVKQRLEAVLISQPMYELKEA